MQKLFFFLSLLLLLCFAALAAPPFGNIPRLDHEILHDAQGIYEVPVNSEFVIEFVRRATSLDLGNSLAAYQFFSMDGSNITYESGTNNCPGTFFFQDLIQYDFLFEATAIDEEHPVRTIILSNNFNPSVSKKVKVVEAL